MNTSEVLNRAADLIEERGWTQGPSGWYVHGRSLCLEGAMAAVLDVDIMAGNEFYGCPAYAAVADYLGRNPQPRLAPIKDALWSWNDDDDRTAEQVIATLRAAAVIEAAKENTDVREPVSA